jgi:hypothetical protein
MVKQEKGMHCVGALTSPMPLPWCGERSRQGETGEKVSSSQYWENPKHLFFGIFLLLVCAWLVTFAHRYILRGALKNQVPVSA